MEQGEYEQKIIDACIRSKQPLPDKILNAPQLWDGLEFYMLAWQELHYDRPTGFGAGPIPSTSLRAYAEDREMDEEDRFVFEYTIRRMDNFYVGHANKESTRKKKE